MGASDIGNVEINILGYENEMFSLLAEFDFNNFLVIDINCIHLLIYSNKQDTFCYH